MFKTNTGATGGGYSVIFEAPDYQRAALRGNQKRAIPDVAFNAAVLHGVIAYLDIPGAVDPGFFRFGGTSAGAPQWASLVAIANQRAGRPLGFLNGAIYMVVRTPLYQNLFHDIVSGNNSAIELDANNAVVDTTGYMATSGWDATTGVGSPAPAALAELLARRVRSGDSDDAANSAAKPDTSTKEPQHVNPH